ncbi:hypothetical protein SRHO_G00192100 [Serrasalmus rhombeus]
MADDSASQNMDSASQKRVPKPTEMAIEEKMNRLCNRRQGKLALLTCKRHDIQQMKEVEDNVEIVGVELFHGFHRIFSEFKEANEEMVQNLSEAEREDEQSNWYKPKCDAFERFIFETEKSVLETCKGHSEDDVNADMLKDRVSATFTLGARSRHSSTTQRRHPSAPASVDTLTNHYTNTAMSALDLHAPLCSREVTFLHSAPWYTPELRIINASLASGIVPPSLKLAAISPILKKPGLAPEDLSNYRPISNLPFLIRLPHIEADVGLLIGVNAYKAIDPWKVVNGREDGPYTVQTVLGWIVNGLKQESISVNPDALQSCIANRISVETTEDLLVQQFNADFPERRYEDKIVNSCNQ